MNIGLYAYAFNNPTNNVDPSGNCSTQPNGYLMCSPDAINAITQYSDQSDAAFARGDYLSATGNKLMQGIAGINLVTAAAIDTGLVGVQGIGNIHNGIDNATGGSLTLTEAYLMSQPHPLPKTGGVVMSALRGLGVAGRVAKPAEELVTIYRGVNSTNRHYDSAKKGIAVPNRRDWQFWKPTESTPHEHNMARNGTLNSPYTSWTTDIEVAINFALRPIRNGKSSGVLLTQQVPRSKIITSPNTKDVLVNGRMVSESEVLIRGKTSGSVQLIER